MKMESDKEIISCLRRQLKEAEEEKRKAAQYGLDLVESESLLQNQLDKLQNEIVTITENFEQEKYTLQREVELKNRMLASMNLEYETLKQHQNIQLDALREQLVRVHGQETNELKNKVEKLKSELDETLLSEKQLKHKVDLLKEALASKSEELRMMSERVHETMSSEVLNLQLELVAVEQAKADLEDRFHDLQYSKEQLELGNSNLTNRLARLEEEREDREKDIVSYCNALEKAHEANRELQLQLDHARQEALDPSSKGNSLFAEVEDRRAEMEHQLISMKVKYQLLQNQYSFTREQQQRLKLQMASLLRMKSSQEEHDQLERLQSMLQQKNGEIEELLMKVKQLEKPMMSENSKELKLFRSTSEYAESEDGYYTDFLQMKLENSDKEIEKLKSELSLQRMKALYESQRVLEIERKLFAKERELEVSQSENINLRVLLDELRIKYQPEELMTDSFNFKKAPGDVISYNLSSRGSSECKTSCMLSQKKEEIKLSEDAMKTTLKAVSMNKVPPPAMEQRRDQPERKKVKIKEEEPDLTAINMKDKNEIGPSPSVSEGGILLRMAKRLSTTRNTTRSTVYEHFALSSDGKHYVCQCIQKDDGGEKQCDAKISSFSGPDKNAPTRASNLKRHLQRFHPKVLEAVNEKDSNENFASSSVTKIVQKSTGTQSRIREFFMSDKVTITMTPEKFKTHIIEMVVKNSLPLSFFSQPAFLGLNGETWCFSGKRKYKETYNWGGQM